MKQMSTIRDVAREAGVGIGTVSRALNGTGYVAKDKREKIMAAVEKLKYIPPERNPKAEKQRSKLIGVILPDIALPFYGSFLKYAEIELHNQGYNTIVFNTLGLQGRIEEAISLVREGQLAGLIINSEVSEDEISRLREIPTVCFERMLGADIPMISSEHKDGGKLAAEIFLENRCMDVLIITARHRTRVYGDYRVNECRRILERHGVKVTIVEFNATFVSFRYVQEVVEQYMDIYNRVDGIFSDDIVAYCCLREAKKRAIPIPRDLKIVGYDGNEITEMITPSVTTIVQNVPLLARTSVEVLLEKIQGEKVKNEYLIPVRMKKGGTS
jgi:LacI family sucrose operon transcriptional repressor